MTFQSLCVFLKTLFFSAYFMSKVLFYTQRIFFGTENVKDDFYLYTLPLVMYTVSLLVGKTFHFNNDKKDWNTNFREIPIWFTTCLWETKMIGLINKLSEIWMNQVYTHTVPQIVLKAIIPEQASAY